MVVRVGSGDRRRLGVRELVEGLESRVMLSGDLLGNHGGAGSTGLVSDETVLTPGNVGSAQGGSSVTTNFGRLFDTAVDGQVYAQVLVEGNVNITRGVSVGVHNVLYVATCHDSLYAIDANTGAILWQDNFTQIVDPRVATIGSPAATAGVTTIPAADTNSSTVSPEIGILSTPAIDAGTGILYLLANTKELRNGTAPSGTGADRHYVQRLWGVRLSDGSVAIAPGNSNLEPASGGEVVGDTIKNTAVSTFTGYLYVAGPAIRGTGNNVDTFNADGTVASTQNQDGWAVNGADTVSIFQGTTPSAEGYIAFNAALQVNRVAVTLVDGEVYVGFASHGDKGPYYGWLLGYSAATLENNAAFVTDPTYAGIPGSTSYNSPGGLWASGAGITTDGTYLYFTVGNGAFNPARSNFSGTYVSSDAGNVVEMPLDGNYGDSVLKVQLDLNATQGNVNLKNALTAPTPDGTYNPDGGYNYDGYGLKVVDYFTPSNAYELNVTDEDLGSSGVLLIPSTGAGSATAPNGDAMLAFAGKEGRVYLVDANNLGGYNTAYDNADGTANTTAADPAPFDRVLGEYYYFETTAGNSGTKANNGTIRSFGTPSYFDGVMYVGLDNAPELGFNVTTTATPNFFFAAGPASGRTGVEPVPVFSTAGTTGNFGVRGTTATISANGLSNGIVWNINAAGTSTDALTAYTPSGALLFSSNWRISGAANATSDTLENGVSGATSVKFSLPTVFNGMVYAGTGGASGSTAHGTVVGYGLLGAYLANNSLMGAPSNLTTVRTAGGVQLNWVRHSVSETETEVDRSTDGVNWSVLRYVGNGASGFLDGGASFGQEYFYRVRAVSGGTVTGFTNTAGAASVLKGDANVDGKVDGADLGIVLGHFGMAGGTWTDGNFDGTGTVDLTEMAEVLNHMGETWAVSGGVVAGVGASADVGVVDDTPVVVAAPVAVEPVNVEPVVADALPVVQVVPVAKGVVAGHPKRAGKPVKRVAGKRVGLAKGVWHWARGGMR